VLVQVMQGDVGEDLQDAFGGGCGAVSELGVEGIFAVAAARMPARTWCSMRAENGGVPPVRLPEAARATHCLSLLERHRIAALKAQGHGVRDIAERLGRSPSTVSRELRRNMLAHDKGRYDGDLAHSRARQRAVRVRRSRLAQDEGLRAVVQAKLELEWSPQQIAGYLRAAFPDRPAWHLCHETIYQGVYNPGPGGLSRTLTRRPRTGRPLRKRRRRATARLGPVLGALPVDPAPPAGRGVPDPARGLGR
jgi:transposase, IS30 family